MNDILSVSVFTSVIYLIVRFINMNFVEKDPQPVKELFKDALFVFISVNLGFFILSQVTSFSLSGGDGAVPGKSVDAFVGEPGF